MSTMDTDRNTVMLGSRMIHRGVDRWTKY
jgi:hypothetical protein